MLGRKKSPYTRKSVRSAVTPSEVRGSIVDAKGRKSDLVLVWNISDEGICLWAGSRHKHGEIVSIVISKPHDMTLKCEVRWCRAIPDKSGYLLGVEALEGHDELRKLHAAVQHAIKAS